MFRIENPRRDHSRLKVNLNWRRMSTVSSYRTLAGVISFEPLSFPSVRVTPSPPSSTRTDVSRMSLPSGVFPARGIDRI